MEPTLSSETSAFILQTPGKFPKKHRLHSKHGESLKTTILYAFVLFTLVFNACLDPDQNSCHNVPTVKLNDALYI